MKFYWGGKKVSKKFIIEKIDKEKLAERIKAAEESWYDDPHELVDWMDGMEIRQG